MTHRMTSVFSSQTLMVYELKCILCQCTCATNSQKTESNTTHQKESQHEDKHRSCGQELNLHKKMKFFSATLLHVLLGRRVHSTCLVASLSTPRHGEDRGLVSTFACLPSDAHFGLSPHAVIAKGGLPNRARACSYFCPDSRTGGLCGEASTGNGLGSGMFVRSEDDGIQRLGHRCLTK